MSTRAASTANGHLLNLSRPLRSVFLAGVVVFGSACFGLPSVPLTPPWTPKEDPIVTPSPTAAPRPTPTVDPTSTPVPIRDDLVHPDEETGIPIFERDGQVCIFDSNEKRATGWKCAPSREEALAKLTPSQ